MVFKLTAMPGCAFDYQATALFDQTREYRFPLCLVCAVHGTSREGSRINVFQIQVVATLESRFRAGRTLHAAMVPTVQLVVPYGDFTRMPANLGTGLAAKSHPATSFYMLWGW